MDTLDIVHSYYRQLNVTSSVTQNLREIIDSATEDQWSITLEQNLIPLSIDMFKTDPKIYQIISDIGDSSRLSIFRFFGNECYNWHTDAVRMTAINMLITGFDSMCIFGKPAPARRLTNIRKLQHEPDQYYLMNVKQMHTVYNFGNEIRYILSLGLPNTTYKDACDYLQQHDLLLNK